MISSQVNVTKLNIILTYILMTKPEGQTLAPLEVTGGSILLLRVLIFIHRFCMVSTVWTETPKETIKRMLYVIISDITHLQVQRVSFMMPRQ